MRVDRKRLEQTIEELGRVGATERGGLTRLALTDEDRRGRDLMVRWMREAGLRVTVDQMGNIFGERAGEPGLPPVMMGSHVDSVPPAASTTASSACSAASRSFARSTTRRRARVIR